MTPLRLPLIYQPYPLETERGRRLRQLRLQIPLSLRQAAAKLGIKVVLLGELERGVASVTEEDWERAYAILQSLVLPHPKEPG
jgi:transcriptional regulator with XRE-family HTH domain